MRPPQLPRRSALLCALLLCASCIFTESAVSPNNTPRDNLDMQQTADSGAGGEDLGAPDLASPPDSGVPDSGVPDSGVPDSGMLDMEMPEDMEVSEDMACQPESDEALCAKFQTTCGPLRVSSDRCGQARAVDCGLCKFGVCQPNGTCVCTPEDNQSLCARLNKACGAATGEDNCGVVRTVESCGACPGVGEECRSGMCSCLPLSDAQLCGITGRQCGTHATTDNCGADRMISCGGCTNGTCSVQGACSTCQPESNEAFCARQGFECGMVSGSDNCNMPRNVNCGACVGGEVCNPSGKTCECPQPMCPPSAQCGVVMNACGASTACGASNGSCGFNPNLTCVGNSCVCQPESDPQFCARLGAQCGTKSGTDNCGVARTASCGACPGGNARCDSNNQCGGGCTMETDAQFCARLGVACGPAQGVDSCTGAPRCVQNCGMCAMGNKCCNAGSAGMSSGSACQPSSAPCTFIPPNIICGAVDDGL